MINNLLKKSATFLSPLLLDTDKIRRKLPHGLQHAIARSFYDLASYLLNDVDITFFNCGYSDIGMEELMLLPEDKQECNCISLYNHLTSTIKIQDLDVLEIGCGRGGGASYISRYLKPKSVTAIDISPKAIDFCKRYHNISGLTFFQGKADKLAFDSESFDVVINIESSMSYPSMNKFLSEVYRVLKPNGHFLFADMREKSKYDRLCFQIKESGLKVIREMDISTNVIRSIELEEERKKIVLNKIVPFFLRPFAAEFGAMKNTNAIYKRLLSGERIYFSYVMQK
ncbi:MAG: class I SAM-dependent methyltransferase [Syntrophaceae bacterium]|nr:class I SAM-dependent methyltransferase [Syntrophaceae bacterium]